MNDLRTAAQQALEALDGLSEDAVCQSSHHAKKDQHTSLDVCPVFLRLRAAITDLRAALAQQAEPVEPVATVTECEACFTPDVCRLRGTCDYYTASQMRIAAPPQRKPLTEEEIDKAYQHIWRTQDDSNVLTVTYWIERGIRYAEKAHGIIS